MALFASLAAHGALIAFLVTRAPAARAPVGVEFSVAEPAAAPAVPSARPRPVPMPSPPRAAAAVAPARRPSGAGQRPAVSGVSGPDSPASDSPAPDSPGVSGSDSPGPDSPASDSPGPDTRRPPPDAEAVRTALQGAIRYPRLARSQGLEGEVIVRFRVDDTGQPRDVSVIRSAGPLLDEAAQAAVARAAPYHSPPGWVRVPVQFSLRDPP